jgi:poly-gamma-glutamate capsule biosynthesis protein CapA/YwtB (metallophosphatase superfamily)
LHRVLIPLCIWVILIPLTLTYSQNHTLPHEQENNLKEKPAIKLITVGDIYLGGRMQEYVIKDPSYPFAATLSVLKDADLLLGNLEVPLSLRGKVWLDKTYTLQSDPRGVHALNTGNFHVVTLANNHIMDFGPDALYQTISVLKEHGILHAGAGANLSEARKPAMAKTGDLTFAILAYNNTFPLEFNAGLKKPGTAYGKLPLIVDDIKKAKEDGADFVVVTFHWSAELLEYPKDYQRQFAHKCIDAGALLVIGHHPHVLQGLEVYREGLIAYSLGNFAFGTFSSRVKDSIILQLLIDEEGILEAVIHPVNVNNHEVNFQPKLRKGADGQRVIRKLQELSSPFGSRILLNDDGTGLIKLAQ